MLCFSALVVLGCLTISLCQSTCPSPVIQENLDLAQIEGGWLGTYTFPNPLAVNCKCDSLVLTEKWYSSGAILTGTCFDTQTQRIKLTLANVEEGLENGQFIGKLLDRDGNPFSLTFYVAATDYDNYAVLYSCSDLGEYSVILSRTGETPADVKDAVDAAMISKGVDPNKFIPIVQDCYNS